MKKILFFIGLVLLSIFGYSQSTLPLRADTIRMYKQGGLAHLKLETANKDSTGGVFYNVGNGVVGIKKTRKINDSTFIVGGDTISIKLIGSGGGGGGGGSYTSSNGIKLSGSNFKLGDYLGEHTTIKGAANAYDFYIDSANVFGATNANSISLSTRAGVAGGTGGNAGQIDITGGNGGTGVTQGGNGAASILQGGDAGAGTTNGVAGYVKIAGGSAPVTGNSAGGSVFVTPGAGVGSGLNGSIYLGVSPSATVRGNTVIGATSDDGTNKLQVTGGVRLLSYLNNANKDSALRVSTTGVIEQYRQTDFGWTVKSGFDSLIWDKSAYELQAKALNITINGSGATKTITDSTVLYDFTVSGGLSDVYKQGDSVFKNTSTYVFRDSVIWANEDYDVKVNTTTNKRSDASSIVVFQDTIFVAATGYGSTSGDNDSAIIWTRYSVDGGRNYVGLDTAVTMSGTGVYIPSMHVQADGDVVMLYFRQNSTTTGQVYKTVRSKSTGNWSAPALAHGTGTNYYAFAANRILKLKNDTLVMPIAINTNGTLTSQLGNYWVQILKSLDDGETWSLTSTFLNGPDSLAVEPGVIQFKSGRLLCYWRSRSGYAYGATSDDNGNTWGTAHALGFKIPNSTITLYYDEETEALYGFHNRDIGGPAPPQQRQILDASISYDEGLTAKRVLVVDSATGYHFIEPSVIRYNNNFLAFYSKGDNSTETLFDLKVKHIPTYFSTAGGLGDDNTVNKLNIAKSFDGTDPIFLNLYNKRLGTSAAYFKVTNVSADGSLFAPWLQGKSNNTNYGVLWYQDMNGGTGAAFALNGHNGGAALGATAKILDIQNDETTVFQVLGDARVQLTGVTAPSTGLANGQFWYDPTLNKFRARENGATVDMISAGGSGISGLTTTFIPKATSSTTIGNSTMLEDANSIVRAPLLAFGPATAQTGWDFQGGTSSTNGLLILFSSTANNAAGTIFRAEKTRVASHVLTASDVVFKFDANTVGNLQFVANSETPGDNYTNLNIEANLRHGTTTSTVLKIQNYGTLTGNHFGNASDVDWMRWNMADLSVNSSYLRLYNYFSPTSTTASTPGFETRSSGTGATGYGFNWKVITTGASEGFTINVDNYGSAVANGNYLLGVQNSGTLKAWIKGNGDFNFAGGGTVTGNLIVTGTAAGITSTSGTSGAVLAGTSFGVEASSVSVPSLGTSLNTAAGVVIAQQYQRGGSFTAGAGDGLEVRFTGKTSTGVSKDYALIHAILTTVTNGSEVGAFEFRLVDGGGTAGLKHKIFGNASVGFYNGAAAPSASITDGTLLYSEDVAASSELKVRDESGAITVLSPHNFTGIPNGRSEALAWAFYSEKNGEYVNVDMLKLARLVEQLTGEKLVYIGDVKSKPNLLNK